MCKLYSRIAADESKVRLHLLQCLMLQKGRNLETCYLSPTVALPICEQDHSSMAEHMFCR